MELKNDLAFEMSCKDEYEKAEKNNDENRMAMIREAHETFIASIDRKDADYVRLFHMACHAHELGNDCIDLNDPSQYTDAEHLILTLRKYGIDRFTFSSGWTSAVESAWQFTQLGCKLEGMTEINCRVANRFSPDGFVKVHAYVFSVN